MRWDDYFSDWFSILAGVRQGGILSPNFYCIYVDDLVSLLSETGIGCHIRDVFLSVLLYADDMALVSPSVKGLQRLLSICEIFCQDWDICLNSKKSKCMAFGKKRSGLFPLQLDGKQLEWVESWSYLGVTLLSGKLFSCSIRDKISKFYKSANAILRIDGRSDELVMLRLLETHCTPILSYAIEVIHVTDTDERRKLRVAYTGYGMPFSL